MLTYSIVLAGVGGQGVLFLSRVLGQAALDSDLEVKVAEIHGMAQRGGSVTSTVRFGKEVFSPTVPQGEADLIVALEPIEALRNIGYANSETLIVLSTNIIAPPGTYLSKEKYPDIANIVNSLRRVSKDVLTIDALELAVKAGNPATQNTVILGLVSASGKLPLEADAIKKSILSLTQKKFQEVNLKAFDLGLNNLD